MKKLYFACFLLYLAFYPTANASDQEVKNAQVDANIQRIIEMQNIEIAKMRQGFQETNIKIELEKEYYEQIFQQINFDIQQRKEIFTESQFFIYVDRNPEKQIIFICFFNELTKSISIIGFDKTSTGNPKRKGFFITPIGIFENSPRHLSYRAEGTKNKKGWRGLGVRGSRVWDFGWQETDHKNSKTKIRLLMHATDPDFGEPRLGKVDSKGCIRISNKLNKFIDHHGLLDKEYEINKDQRTAIKWILKKDRAPVNFIGKYVVVGDSTKS